MKIKELPHGGYLIESKNPVHIKRVKYYAKMIKKQEPLGHLCVFKTKLNSLKILNQVKRDFGIKIK